MATTLTQAHDPVAWQDIDRRLRNEIDALRQRERAGEQHSSEIRALQRARNAHHQLRRDYEGALYAALPEGVSVSRWGHGRLLTQNRWGDPVRSDRSLGYRVIVVARTPDGHIVHEEDVCGGSRYEPDSRNSIGGRGAYRDLPPSQEQIDAAVERARIALAIREAQA